MSGRGCWKEFTGLELVLGNRGGFQEAGLLFGLDAVKKEMKVILMGILVILT